MPILPLLVPPPTQGCSDQIALDAHCVNLSQYCMHHHVADIISRTASLRSRGPKLHCRSCWGLSFTASVFASLSTHALSRYIPSPSVSSFVIPYSLQNHPTLSRFVHVVPLLGTCCMAGIELVLDMKSPTLAVVVLLLSVLPFVTTVLHHSRQCEETPLPVRMRNPPPTI